MSNRKNKDNASEKLKQVDRVRSTDSSHTSKNNDFVEKYTKARGSVSSVFTKKSKFPIGLDIFISLLLVVLVAALVVGAYFLIVRFNDSHDNATIEYVMLADKASVEGVEKGNNVYTESNGSVNYLGSVIDINENIAVASESSFVAITVRVDAQYRDDEGYKVNDEKIAVGRTICVCVGDSKFNGDIIELSIMQNK